MMKISPSILSCDFSRMGEEFARMENVVQIGCISM